MGGGPSTLSSQSTVTVDDLPVTDPDKCQHKFCEKWGPGHYHCADCHTTVSDKTLIASEDAIIESIVDESVAEDGVYRGVSIQFLVDFTMKHKCWDMTTRDVRRRFVMPATRSSRCRFVELPEMQQSPQKYVGRAGTFVSHTWGAKFGDLVAALCDGGADRSRYVWVDIFAVRQWPSRKPDLDFSAVVRQCGSFVVVCSSLKEIVTSNGIELISSMTRLSADVRNQIAFLRVWCLVEIHTAVAFGAYLVMKGGSFDGFDSQGNVLFSANRRMLENLMYLVDIESADATVASDKERILNEIRASEGGVDAVNRAVRGAITGSLMSNPLVQSAACDDQIALAEILKSPTEYIVSAAGCGFVKLLQVLIDNGADVDMELIVDANRYTPLEAAAVAGQLKCVTVLSKCDCFLRNKAMLVCLPALWGHTAVVATFLDMGCNVNEKYDGLTPIMHACMGGHTECAQLLLDRGADPNVVSHGFTAMGFAALCNRCETIQMLIDHGVTTHSEKDTSTLHAAVEYGHVKCIDVLVKSGCDIDKVHRGITPLICAALTCQTGSAQRLIDAGCKLDTVDSLGRTALTIAESEKMPDLVALLKQYIK